MRDVLPAAIANLVVTLAYVSIGVHILRGVHQGGTWRSNPLAVATGMIFLTCAAGHAGHASHLFDPGTREASLEVYDLHLMVIDGVTAVIAIRYWLLRSRFPALVRGAAVFEDLNARREEALDVHDQVVQRLATAKLAFELGRHEEGMSALEDGLDSSRGIVTRLIGDEQASNASMRASGLRRGDRR